MSNITYTFPADCPLAALRGVTVTGGKLQRVLINKVATDVVVFETKVNGQSVTAKVAGKPELEAILASKKAEEKEKTDAMLEQHRLYMQTLPGQREALAIAEENSYSPNYHPGSNAWHKNAAAANALRAFDAAHPEIVAGINAARAAKAQVEWDAMSDFVKMGS